jgi:hypothetical protein
MTEDLSDSLLPKRPGWLFKSLAATLSVAMALVLKVAQLRGGEPAEEPGDKSRDSGRRRSVRVASKRRS